MEETTITSMHRRVDVITLKQLAQQLKKDADAGLHINPAAIMSIVGIIEQAVGAPTLQASFCDGIEMADKLFPGDQSSRAAFNYGVAWTIFRVHASPHVKFRSDRP